MSLKMLIEAQRDDQSFNRVADEAQDTFARAGKDAGEAFDRGLTSQTTNIRGNMQKLGRDAGDSFKTEFRRGINDAVSGATSEFGALGRVADSTFSAIPTKAAVAAIGVAGIGVAAVAVGKQLYDLGSQWDSISDGITVRTGRVGSSLKQLTDVVGDVGKTTAASLGDIGDIVGQLAQSMPGLTENSGAVRQMASNLAYLDAKGQSVSIRELGKAFSAFNVNAADQVKTLDQLFIVSQNTGIPINDLVKSVQTGAVQFKQFGLNMGQATSLLSSFEGGGLDADSALQGLQNALQKLGTDARGPQAALADTIDQIKKLHDAGQEGGAQTLAQQVFGGDNFAPFLDAIESGRVNVDGLKKSIDEAGLSVANTQRVTDDAAQGWQKLSNTLKTDLKPAGDLAFGTLNTYAQATTFHFGQAIDVLTGLDSKLQDVAQHAQDLAAVAVTPITPDSALGKMLLPGGGLPGMAGTAAPNAAGSALSQSTLRPYSWGSNLISPPATKSGSNPKLPDAPVLPYDTTLPTGYGNLPQTSEIVGAENSYMDARHTLAEKQARVNQLEHDNTATAADIQKARNDVVNAEQGQQQAELRLQDARQSLYDKANKQFKDQISSMSEFGAQLDSDFGISKGLAGIAENLTKFIGNLIAAPFLSQMEAITQADPHKGGYGLMGMLGAQGAFGPQYTGLDYSKQGSQYAQSAGGVPLPGGGGGQPYGLPRGSNSGGYGGGGVQFPDWVYQLENDFGVKPSTYPGHQETNRNEAGFAPNPDDLNRAIDWSGPVDNMERFADYLASIPSSLEQVIWQNPSTGHKVGIAGGRDVSDTGYYAGDYGEHGNHVHTRQSQSIPLPGGGGGGPQWSADWNAIAQGESGGNWGINTGNGFSGGLQFTPSSWQAAGGGQYAPSADQATPYQQALTAEQLLAMQGPGAWPNTFVPGSSGPAPSWQTGAPPGLPTMGGAGQSPLFGAPTGPGAGMGVGSIGAGPFGLGGSPGVGGGQAGQGVGPTQIGGVAPLQGSGKGGIGMTEGGSLDTALGLAASAFPGVGQAAQTGMKLANRAIQYGGQVAGIMSQGWMDTFLPMGGSQLAQGGWAARLIGGLAGAAPALPNVAGKSSQPLSPEQAAAQQQGQGGGQQQMPPPQITVNNNRATEDGTGRDIAYHMQNSYQPAAMG